MSRTYIKKAIRKKVLEQAQGMCEYCKSPRAYATELFTLDHIIPISKDGSNTANNLAYCCSGCNIFKSDIIVILADNEQEWITLYHPRTQDWSKHFAWSEDYKEIIGLTPSGRVTVELLRLNRNSLKNLREVLVVVGKHPPITIRKEE